MPGEIIREDNYRIVFALPEIDWLTEYTARLAEAYRRYALRLKGNGSFCQLCMDWDSRENLGSLRLEVSETCGEQLRIYRRLALNWITDEQLLLRESKLLRLAGCRPVSRADGYYFREGQLYAFRNLFRPGLEEGMRRSAWRTFIAEYPAEKR